MLFGLLKYVSLTLSILRSNLEGLICKLLSCLLSLCFTLINTIKQKARKWQVIQKIFFTFFYSESRSQFLFEIYR